MKSLDTYRIVRFYARPGKKRKTMHTGLTLEQAKEHCSDPETSSNTCQEPGNREHTQTWGDWFDGFQKEDR